ncbi:hypothetical protein WDU94_012075 [Cyamophila willieti]
MDLGVDTIWLSPVYKSPMVDFGYDVSDYKDIDPVFGNMADFEELLTEAKAKDLNLLMDFVPNHSSNQHLWFLKSVERIHPYSDYYIWRDPKIENGQRKPPNNWLSGFRGSAWEWNEKRQQYYYHMFAVQQPDLNYRNPAVVEEMKNVLRFWLDKGVHGFRMDAIPFLFESTSLADEPKADYWKWFEPTDHDYLNHTLTENQPETYSMLYEFRDVLDSYRNRDGRTRFMMTECYTDLNKMMPYYGNGSRNGAHFPLNFRLVDRLNRESTAADFVKTILEWEATKPADKWSNWFIGNHDQKRAASRFDAPLIDGLTMLIHLLPGTPITYYGDELGMEDSFVRWDQTVDPAALNVGRKRYKTVSRDFEREPFQWDASSYAGFTSANHTWLPVNSNYWKVNLAAQKLNLRSHYNTFRAMAKLRRKLTVLTGSLKVKALSTWQFCVLRSLEGQPTFILVINLGSDIEMTNLSTVQPNLPDTLYVYAASENSLQEPGSPVQTSKFLLRPKQALTLSTIEVY